MSVLETKEIFKVVWDDHYSESLMMQTYNDSPDFYFIQINDYNWKRNKIESCSCNLQDIINYYKKCIIIDGKYLLKIKTKEVRKTYRYCFNKKKEVLNKLELYLQELNIKE